MFKIIILSFLVFGCDQFKDQAPQGEPPPEQLTGRTIQIDCSQLYDLGDNLLQVHLKNNNRVTHYLTGFQITKAKNCPTLRYTNKNINLRATAFLKNKKQVVCVGKLENKKIVLKCPKSSE